MSQSISKTDKSLDIDHNAHFTPRMYGIAIIVTGIVLTGIWLISRFTAMDLARDMQNWQEKLNLVAESRSDEVNKWVSGNFKELRDLADNPSMQLYMSELQILKSPESEATIAEAEPAQKSYLRNLLLFTAERAGYTSASTVPAIHANVQDNARGGLAVIDKDGEVVVSTAMSADTRALALEKAAEFVPGHEGLIDMRAETDGQAYIGFSVPVYSIQGERNANSQIGRVIGIKPVDGFFGLLKHPGVTEQTLETILVRVSGSKLEYMSPLLDGASALSKQVDFDTKRTVESALVETTGNFIGDKEDYRKKKVLATSRSVVNTPWTLIVKVDSSEALAESNQRRAGMIVFFFCVIAIIVLIIFAVWWHAHSKRAMMMSYHFKHLAAKAQAQEHLLRLVADHQPEPIYIVDGQQIFQFANKQTANSVEMSPENIIGKSMNDVCGTARAEKIAEQCAKARDAGQIIYGVSQVMDDDEEKIIRSAYVPLSHIPVVTLPNPTPGVLVVEQDISEVVHEREQRINTHHQLIQTLIKLVDRRDPFAADHSMLVSHVACEVAIDMELDNIIVETTRTAGSLMNIGKIVVPTELLTKTEALTPDERQIIHDSMNAAADLIREIRFDGPVAETLKQWQERWDGTGPLRLQGEDILISARIIAVSNAFIGMISPRSWRNAINISAANKFLLDQSDTLFDRKVVVALINYVENHNGHVWINQVLAKKRSAA